MTGKNFSSGVTGPFMNGAGVSVFLYWSRFRVGGFRQPNNRPPGNSKDFALSEIVWTVERGPFSSWEVRRRITRFRKDSVENTSFCRNTFGDYLFNPASKERSVAWCKRGCSVASNFTGQLGSRSQDILSRDPTGVWWLYLTSHQVFDWFFNILTFPFTPLTPLGVTKKRGRHDCDGGSQYLCFLDVLVLRVFLYV